MLDILSHLDTQLFLFVNTAFACRALDIFFVYITNPNHWIAPLSIVAVLLIVRFEKGGPAGVRVLLRQQWRRNLAIILLAAVAVGLSDSFCARIVKPLFQRPRPCNPQHLIEGGRFLLGYKTSSSMPSIHASNACALATVFAWFFRRQWLWLYSVAGLVALSRVYVGVHYPGDALVGAVVGVAMGTLVYAAWSVARRRAAGTKTRASQSVDKNAGPPAPLAESHRDHSSGRPPVSAA